VGGKNGKEEPPESLYGERKKREKGERDDSV